MTQEKENLNASGASKPLTAKERANEERKKALKAKKEHKMEERRRYGYKVNLSGEQMLTEGMTRLKNRDFIFVSLDLELWELDPYLITEIGISILDMTDQATRLVPSTKSFHLIPNENFKYKNGKRIADKKHLFTQGRSVRMSMKECQIVWDELLEKLKKRSPNVYLVGHDVASDLFALNKNGFSYDQRLPVLDTWHIWTATSSLSSSLGSILGALEIEHAFLHNAGNDAYYTLRALVDLLDPAVREKYGLDIGPSLKEANRMAQSQRRKTNDPDELPIPLSPEQIKQNQEEEELKKLTQKERDAFRAKKKAMREMERLKETIMDTPGKYVRTKCKDLLKTV